MQGRSLEDHTFQGVTSSHRYINKKVNNNMFYKKEITTNDKCTLR